MELRSNANLACLVNLAQGLLCDTPVSADPRLLGALRKTVSGGGGGLGWMRRICPCFTPSRIALAESARGAVSLSRLV